MAKEQLPFKALTPEARPIDTFMAVPAKQNNGLQALADGLADAVPKLQRALDAKDEAQKTVDLAEGRKLRLKNNLAYNDAVKHGLIPEGASPYLVKAYKKMDGSLRAREEYNAFISEKVYNSGVAENDYNTPGEASAAYNNIVSAARRDYLNQHADSEDYSWLAGFEESRGSIENTLGTRFVSDRIKANEDKFEAAAADTFYNIFSTVDPKNIGDVVDAEVQRLHGSTGFSRRKLNKIIAEQAANKSEHLAYEGDYLQADNLLKALDKVPGYAGKITKNANVRDIQSTARQKIRDIKNRKEQEDYSRELRDEHREDRPFTEAARDHAQKLRDKQTEGWEHEDDIDGLIQDALIVINGENEKVSFEDVLKDAQKSPHTAKAIPQLNSLWEAIHSVDKSVVENTTEVAKLRERIVNGTAGSSEIIKMVDDKKLKGSTVTSLFSTLLSVQRNEGMKRMLTVDQRSEIADAVSLVKSAGEGKAFPRRYIIAGRKLETDLINWQIKNPDASTLELRTQADKLFDGYMKRIDLGEETFDRASTPHAKNPVKTEDPKQPQIPAAHIKYLKENKDNERVRRDFDRRYSEGSAARILGE